MRRITRRCPAAVDRDDLTRDEGSIVGGEERQHRGDLVGCARAAERRGLNERALVVDVTDDALMSHRCVNDARRQRIYEDAVRPQLGGELAGRMGHAGFCRRVGGTAGMNGNAKGRRDVQDTAAGAGQVRHDIPGETQYRDEVDVDDPGEIIVAGIGQPPR